MECPKNTNLSVCAIVAPSYSHFVFGKRQESMSGQSSNTGMNICHVRIIRMYLPNFPGGIL